MTSRFPLSQKYIDFINSVNVAADFLEGTTASGKTTVGAGVKFMRMVSQSAKKLHVIAAKTTGKAEETIIHQDNGILDLHQNARYFGNGDKDYKLPHIKFENKIIYILGYGSRDKWEMVLGAQFGCVYIDEINTADIEFVREMSTRNDYLMATLNPDDPSLPVYREFVNRSRPYKKYENDIPLSIRQELTEEPVSGWRYWFFSFADNLSLSEADIEKKKASAPKGTKLYKNKIKTDPNTLAGYNMVPTSATNYYTNVYQLLGNGPGYMWFISANSRHKKEALELFDLMGDPDFMRELILGRRGETWDYDADGVPRMNEYGQEQLDAYKAGSTDPDNYFVKWGSFDKMPSNWPVLRDNSLHPDGLSVDFVTNTREYKKATMGNNISRDICKHYGVELPTDAFYNEGGLDFRNDCGEAISSCMSSLNRDQLNILSKADAVLTDAQVDLILAETDEEWEAIRDEKIRELVALGEPEVFKAYQKMWNEAAEVIVPLVRQVQIKNGIEPYTPEDYADYPGGGTEVQEP